MTANNVIKFPYDASRRLYSRRPRASKNGTPEERASKAPVATADPEINQEIIQLFCELTPSKQQFFLAEIAKWPKSV